MSVSIEVEGMEGIISILQKLRENIADNKKAFTSIVDSFHTIQKEQFRTEGARGPGGRWKPLAPSYRKWKQKHHPSKRINEISGLLRESFIRTDASNNIERISEDRLEMGSKMAQAVWLHEGRRSYPQRKLIDITVGDHDLWVSIIHNHIWEGIE